MFTNINSNNLNKDFIMNINSQIDLIKLFGWSISSKIVYILNELKNNKTTEELYREIVEKNELMKSKSFYNLINKIDRIEKDISFV